MEKEPINQQELLAKNLAYYRKASGLTQLELAEKFNYSDKSVSKWERGEGFPDIFVLKSLADFYGITVDDFYQEEHKQVVVSESQKRKQVYLKLLSLGITWLVVTLAFFVFYIVFKNVAFKPWLVFIYGLTASGIVLLVWNYIFHRRLGKMLSTTLIIWSGALSIFLTALVVFNKNWWLIFIVAIPLEILEFIWFLYRRKKNRD